MQGIVAFFLCGVACGFYLRLAGIFSTASLSNLFTFINDVLCVLACTLAFFCLYVGYSDGYVRYYFLLSFALGVGLYMLVSSLLFSKVETKIVAVLRKFNIRILSYKKEIKNACNTYVGYNIIKVKNKMLRGVSREGKSRKDGK